jgi:hypothetical protein
MGLNYENKQHPEAKKSLETPFEFYIGKFNFKNSTGSNDHRFWCEFRPQSDPDLMASENY